MLLTPDTLNGFYCQVIKSTDSKAIGVTFNKYKSEKGKNSFFFTIELWWCQLIIGHFKEFPYDFSNK